VSSYSLPSSRELTRRRPLGRLLEPFRDRRFLYSRYDAFLDRVAAFTVVPLRELAASERDDRTLVGLRHDIDDRLESALVLAELEHQRGLRATYFVLHTARYYNSPRLLPALQRLQELGHEVGFHNDLVTLQVVDGLDPRDYLGTELQRLREAGIDVTGVAAHGSYWGHRLGYRNEYFFRELETEQPGFPATTRVGSVELEKGTLAEFGLAYDASQLQLQQYWTDSWVDPSGRRWHPELAELDELGPGDRAVVLVHPCHWDSSLAAKLWRTVARLASRSLARRQPPFAVQHERLKRAS
jgi:hypothetical protein